MYLLFTDCKNNVHIIIIIVIYATCLGNSLIILTIYNTALANYNRFWDFLDHEIVTGKLFIWTNEFIVQFNLTTLV